MAVSVEEFLKTMNPVVEGPPMPKAGTRLSPAELAALKGRIVEIEAKRKAIQEPIKATITPAELGIKPQPSNREAINNSIPAPLVFATGVPYAGPGDEAYSKVQQVVVPQTDTEARASLDKSIEADKPKVPVEVDTSQFQGPTPEGGHLGPDLNRAPPPAEEVSQPKSAGGGYPGAAGAGAGGMDRMSLMNALVQPYLQDKEALIQLGKQQVENYKNQKEENFQAARDIQAQQAGVAEANMRRQEQLERYQQLFNNTTQELADTKIDENKWWNDKSTAEKIGTGLGVILASIGSGIKGSATNAGVDMIDKAISHSIDVQRSNAQIKGKVADMSGHAFNIALARVGNAEQAEAIATASMYERIKRQIEGRAQDILGNKDQQQLQEFLARLDDRIMEAQEKFLTAKQKGGGGGGGGGSGAAGANGANADMGTLVHLGNDIYAQAGNEHEKNETDKKLAYGNLILKTQDKLMALEKAADNNVFGPLGRQSNDFHAKANAIVAGGAAEASQLHGSGVPGAFEMEDFKKSVGYGGELSYRLQHALSQAGLRSDPRVGLAENRARTQQEMQSTIEGLPGLVFRKVGETSVKEGKNGPIKKVPQYETIAPGVTSLKGYTPFSELPKTAAQKPPSKDVK